MTIAISDDFLLAFSQVDRRHQKGVREFFEKFRRQPDLKGLNYEPVHGARDRNLHSVRIDQKYRAIVYHPSGSDLYLLAWVDNHDAAYKWAESRRFAVNPMTGAVQVIRVDTAIAPATAAAPAPKGLFAKVKDKHLLRLGVPEDLLPLARSIEDKSDLDQAKERLPDEAWEALYFLSEGFDVDKVLEEMNKAAVAVAVDTGDVKAALEHEDSKRRFCVIEEAKDLADLLGAPLDRWRVFLHPKQRSLVTMRASGPVRVLGGAGTGKTVVAMHRAKHLAEQVFSAKGDRLLFTTFTRNLATDIHQNLRSLCEPEVLSRIEVINLDAWVANFLRTRGYAYRVLVEEEENEFWEDAVNEAPPGLGLSTAFYRNEWVDVVQAQDISTVEQYVFASRVGRGTRISREMKRKIWPVFQEYRARLNERNAKEFIDLLRDARRLIEEKGIALPYRSVIVDEAQDMSAEAFRLIRALVPKGENDVFVVGDAHQRIYRHRASLTACGIDIRGRGKKLRINYRTTEETRRFAVALLLGQPIDDLGGEVDDQNGYVSLTHGVPPDVRLFGSQEEEVGFLRQHLEGLRQQGAALESVCLAARTQRLLETYEEALKKAGFECYRIRHEAAEQSEKSGLRTATLHRVKGLEFDHVVIVAANAGVIPLQRALQGQDDETAKRHAELMERALLYVALTRARRTATVTGYGELSPFLSSKHAKNAIH